MHRPLRLAAGLTPALLLGAAALPAAAQPAPPPPASVKAQYVAPVADAERKNGVSPGLILGATLNVVDNRDVVGQPVGTGFSGGYLIDGSVDYNNDKHEWRNALLMSAGTTRTPAVSAWIKTRDTARFETIYLYHAAPWIGPFGRFALDTQMFPGSDPQAKVTTYNIARADGTTETLSGTRLHLSDWFQPLTLKQSLGVFVQPLDQERIHLEGRLGAGAQEVFADGALALADKAETPDFVEVKELKSFQQLGAEALIEAKGLFPKAKISYKAGVGVMVPFVRSEQEAGDTRGPFELTNLDMIGNLSFKIVEWASLDYQLRVLRQPQLVDAWQVSNNLLLTMGLALGTKKPKEPEVPVCAPAPETTVPPPPAAPPGAPPAAPPGAPPAAPPVAPAGTPPAAPPPAPPAPAPAPAAPPAGQP
ncbi:MAG: hypothetical protein U0359_06660 [Byssovorax sp.]